MEFVCLEKAVHWPKFGYFACLCGEPSKTKSHPNKSSYIRSIKTKKETMSQIEA